MLQSPFKTSLYYYIFTLLDIVLIALLAYTKTLLLELTFILISLYFTIYSINSLFSLYKDIAFRIGSYTNISLYYTLTLPLKLPSILIYSNFFIYSINSSFSLYKDIAFKLSFYINISLLYYIYYKRPFQPRLRDYFLEQAPILIYPYLTIYSINSPFSLYKNVASITSSYINISLLL